MLKNIKEIQIAKSVYKNKTKNFHFCIKILFTFVTR